MIVSNILVDDQTTLKVLQKEDTPIIFNAINENKQFLKTWLPFIENTKSEKDTASFVYSVVDDVERRQEIFTIWNQQEFTGLIGLKDIDYLNYKMEIGYWIIPSKTKKGIVTKSVEKLIEFGFKKLGMNRIQIKCGVGNYSSSAIPKKLGFALEGIERQGERHNIHYIDLEVYSLLKKEWFE